jgi:radical SAM superfamily enzyme YgiQ (UPF0313 family)
MAPKTPFRPEDIAFIINPSLWYQNMYPSGLLCLTSYLKDNNIDSVIIDSKLSSTRIPFNKRINLIIKYIKKIKPKIVGLSTTNLEFNEVVKINKAIKKIDKDIFIIVGGSQPTYRAKDFLNNGFDFICIGEGEKTILEFVQEIQNKTFNWKKINGLVWKDGNKYIFNPPRQLMTEIEMNEIKSLSFDKIDPRYFDINLGIIRGLPVKGALLLSTRGCPFNCSYCGCNLIFGRKLRFKTMKNIEAEIKYLKQKYDIEGIWIVDDTFTISEKHILGVCKILKKYGIIWGCQSRVDTINEKIIRIMKQSGCVQVDFGVESGSQRILDEIIFKRTNIPQIIKAFELAKKYKLRTLANFMLGLPTETYEDLEKTKKLAEKIKADVYLFSIATPLPGTKLYEMINIDIKPEQYALLNWNGSSLTEKLNKSKIKNLVKERQKLAQKFLLRYILKSIISPTNFLILIKMKHKFKRFTFIVGYINRRLIFKND